MENNFDKQYFDVLMEKAVAQGADPTLLSEGKKALQFASPDKLKNLLTSSPEQFYKNFAEVVCSAALDNRTNESKLNSFLMKAKAHTDKESDPRGFFYNGMRYVAATLLGLVKFAWDILLIGGAFGVRFGIRLSKNLVHAVTKTVAETGADAKHAGFALKESFDRNILGKIAVKTDENVVMEIVNIHDIAAAQINAVSLTIE